MNSSRPSSDHAPKRLEANPFVKKVVHFAEEFGWWRVVAIPILAVLTIWVLVDIVVAKPAANSQQPQDNAPVQTSRPHAAGEERSEEHTSELQSRFDLVCRLLLEKKNKAVSSQST